MQNMHTTTLNRQTLMFPLALVLFELAVYIGNDLIQPAMLAITQDFGVSSTWAPSSMSFYLLGGASVAWLLLSLIHISEPTRPVCSSRMPSSA